MTAKMIQEVFAPVEKKKRSVRRTGKPGYKPTSVFKQVHILSMGAGVQTTAMLLKYGPTGRYDYVVFADTKEEITGTYEYIERYLKPFCKKIGLPWVTVSKGEGIFDYYIKTEGLPKKMTRDCTRDFKIRPINRFATSLGCTEENPMLCDIGFSIDESRRLNEGKKDKEEKYIQKCYPLLDEKISRKRCHEIIDEAGWPSPTKSGCWFCPFKSRKYFRNMAVKNPKRFAKAVALEQNDRKYPKFPLDGRALLTNILENARLDADAIPDVEDEDGCDTAYCWR